ncbi:MAG: PAS domain S-box protein [Aphanothece sp. CMT-3BRIN-NPC111]|jgi:PAS domain S-box-containing protein|nr:PAS domain S-box protein [Aphanothece sp. CMT-3BRIN-NPC111]
MQRFIERRIVAIGLVLALLILGSIGVIYYQNSARLLENHKWVKHAYTVLEDINDVTSDLKSAEEKQQNYSIADNASYLETYQLGVAAINQKIKNLQQLTANNPNQERRLNDLQFLIAKRLVLLQESIDLQTSDKSNTAVLVSLINQGRDIHNAALTRLEAMKAEEWQLLQPRLWESELGIQKTIIFFLVEYTLGLGLLVGFFLLLQQRRRDHQPAGDALDITVQEHITELTKINESLQAEINNCQQAEKTLYQALTRCNLLAEATVEGIAIHDLGHILDANQAFAKLFGYEANEVIGMSAAAFFTPESQTLMMQNAQLGYEQPYEVAAVRKDGTPLQLEVFGKKSVYQGRNVLESAVLDITERKQAEKMLKDRARQQMVVVELSQQALAGRDLSELMDRVVTIAAQTLEVEYCQILELLPDNRAVFLRAGVGWQEGLVGHATVDINAESQAGYILFDDKPVIVEDLRKETQFSELPLLHEHGVVSGMSVVIQGQERPFGVLGVYTTRRRTFTKDDTYFLQAVANLLPQAIERKQAEIALHQANDKLEVRVAERTVELRTANEQLQLELHERQQAESALRESEERYRRLVELSPETIAVYSQGKFVYINPAGIRLLGASSLEAIIDKPILEIVHPKDRQAFEGQIKQVQEVKRAVELPALKLVQLSGQVIDVEMNASSIFYKGKPAVQVVLRDITERLEVERMKDEFISVISHELRTPLTSIRGSLGLLASGLLLAQPEKSQRMLEIAVSNADRLIRLINDILDLDRISSGTENMEKQACNAAELMQQAVDEMRGMAENNAIVLCVSPLKTLLWADRDRIIQVLTNLLSNAIKFSSPGTKVWLTAQKQGQEVVFQVTDQGRGIPADKIESIFERFQQVDASDSRQKGGTGLGLAISRHIVQQHGGVIWVTSTVNQGSSFYFTLPLLQKILRQANKIRTKHV